MRRILSAAVYASAIVACPVLADSDVAADHHERARALLVHPQTAVPEATFSSAAADVDAHEQARQILAHAYVETAGSPFAAGAAGRPATEEIADPHEQARRLLSHPDYPQP